MSPDTPQTVLVLSVAAAERTALARDLTDAGQLDAEAVGDPETVLERVQSGDVGCVVTDHDLPDIDGLALLEHLRAMAPTLPVVLFTSEGDESIASRAISAGVTEYLVKERHRDQTDRLARLVETAMATAAERSTVHDHRDRVRTVLDAARDTIAIVQDGGFCYLNEAGLGLFDLSDRRALYGDAPSDWLQFHGDDGTGTAVGLDGGPVLGRTRATVRREHDVDQLVEVTASTIDWDGGPATALVLRAVTPERDRGRDGSLFATALDDAPIGICLADATRPDNPLVYVNEGFERLTGYDAATVLERNCRFLQGPDTDAESVDRMRRAIDADEPVTVELRNYRADGTAFWNRVSIAPLRDESGVVTHYIGFQEDVTDRVESERDLRRFRQAVEAAGHAIYITDPDGTIRFVNDAFEEITGYAESTAVGQTPKLLDSGEMDDEYFASLWETISRGDVWAEEVVNRRKDGDLYYANQTIAPITEDGEVTSFVAVQTDITAQREREDRLRQYEQAIEGATDLIAAVDTDRRYLFANPAYREFHGLEDEVVGRHLSAVLDEADWTEVQPHVERVMDGETVRYEMERHQPGQANRRFDIRYMPLRNADGDIRGAVATMRDVTDLEERSQQISVLDRVLRHNLRNDLNVVTASATAIAERHDGETRERAKTISSVAEDLLSLADKEREIVDLLEDPGDQTTVDLGPRIRALVARVEADHPGATIDLDAPSTLPVTALPQIDRALVELVRNACEHGGPAPVVTLTATVDEDVTICVSDDGPGIPDSERAIIEGETVEEGPLFHGSGLGLWLVNWLVTHSGGDVSVSVEGGETSVRLTLPRAPDLGR